MITMKVLRRLPRLRAACIAAVALFVADAVGAGSIFGPGLGTSQAFAADALRIQGSTTFFERVLAPNLARVEELSGTKLEVVPNKSIWGLIALLERRSDLAMISAGLDGEIEVARRTAPDLPYGELRIYEIARSRIGFAVHPSNPVRTLLSAQVADILRGTLTNWRDVGGPDLPIRVVATQDGGGTVVAVRTQLLDGQPISAPGAVRPESARHVVQVVAQEPGAIGIAQLGLLKKAGLPEIETEKPVIQILSFVAIGEAKGTTEAVIAATKSVAEE